MRSTWMAGLALALAGESQEIAGTPRPDDAGERGRNELAALVRDVLARPSEPAVVPLTEKERAFGLEFAAVDAGGVRVLATTGVEEAQRGGRLALAARELFLELTGVSVKYPVGLTLYLIGTGQAKDTFLAKHPAVTPETRPSLARLDGASVGGTIDWGFWEGDAEKRLDTLVRLCVGWLFDTQGTSLGKNAWLHEGMGFYLTHALVGTRQTFFIPLRPRTAGREAGTVALLAQMKELDADWLSLARGLFADEKLDLEELLHLEARELDARDHLRAHALAAYIVEANRAALAGIVARLGADEYPRTVLEEALGIPLPELSARLEVWLEQRELQVARAEGRRSEAELLAQWAGLNAAQRSAAVAGFRAALQELDTQQMRWLRSVLARAPAEPPPAEPAPFYDPKVHAPAQPIPRKRLAKMDAKVRRLLEEVRGTPDPRAPISAYAYDWFSRRVVRIGPLDDPETVFHNAVRGLPPGADRAAATLIALLDHAGERKLQAAFAHAYTDRDGGVYPITLFEMWASRTTIEMPDVDALGIVHELLNEWSRWVAPVPGEQHEELYAEIGKLYLACKRSRELRQTVAELFLAPSPTPRPGYETHLVNLHALWAEHASDPARLVKVLPDGGEAWEPFLNDLTERCKRDNALSATGRKRAAQLRKDVEELRKHLGAALDAAAAAAAAPLGGDAPGGR